MVATQFRAWPYRRNEVGIVGCIRKPKGFVKSDTAIGTDTSLYPVRGIPTIQQRRLPCTTASFSSSWLVPSLGWSSRHVDVNVTRLTAVCGRGRSSGWKMGMDSSGPPEQRYHNVTLDSTRRMPHWGVSQRIHPNRSKPRTFPIMVGPANEVHSPTFAAGMVMASRTIQESHAYHLRVWHINGGGLTLMWLGPTPNPAILCTRQVVPETMSYGSLILIVYLGTYKVNPDRTHQHLKCCSIRGIPNHWRTR